MGRYFHPHSIDNGAGERLTFTGRVAGAAGDRLEGENVVAPGAGVLLLTLLQTLGGALAALRPGGARAGLGAAPPG